MKVLIIEDDPGIVQAVSLALSRRWPEAGVVAAKKGLTGVEMVQSERPDAVILDLGLPDISGFEVLKRVRLFSNVPVLILTVVSDEAAVVKGLEWGADDYVVKPFRQKEFLSRMMAVTRRGGAFQQDASQTCGPLRLDLATGHLVYHDRQISLTPTESTVLYHLMKSPGQVVTHAAIAEILWGQDHPGAADSLKVYVRRLREKIEADPEHPQLILTRPGFGYLLAGPE